MRIPANERQRLAAVGHTGMTGTPPDPWFDVFTEAAAQLLGAPVAAFTLVGADHQWLKSRVGTEMAYTPRTEAFCHYTIASPDRCLVVADALQDARFREYSYVVNAPGLRSYAGVAVRSPAGHRLGALCVLDSRPRHFTAGDLGHLQVLANGIEAILGRYRDGHYLDADTWPNILPEGVDLLRRGP